MRKAILAVLTTVLLLGAVPAWADASLPTQPGPVSTFGFYDARNRDVSSPESGYEMWPAWQDTNLGTPYSQPLIVNGKNFDDTPATYVIAVGGGQNSGSNPNPEIVIYKNIQAQPTGQFQSPVVKWSHPLDGINVPTSHPSLYDIGGRDIVFVGTEPGSDGYSYIDAFEVTDILNGGSKGTSVLAVEDTNATDIVSAPLLMSYQGHLVLVYSDGNSGRVGLMYNIDGVTSGSLLSTASVGMHSLNPGDRISSSPAPVMNGTAFAIGMDTGSAPGAVYLYRLQALFTVRNDKLVWNSSPSAFEHIITWAGVDASFSVSADSNKLYFADSRSNIYGADVTQRTKWVNSDINFLGYPSNFTNRSPAFDATTNMLYVPVGTNPNQTQSGVVAINVSDGTTKWVSQYQQQSATTDPNNLQTAGFDSAGNVDPTNAQTAPVIMPCTEAGVPLIMEGLGDDQIGYIDSSDGYEPMSSGPIPEHVTGSYATGVTGEISLAGNLVDSTEGLIAYTTQDGVQVLDFAPTDVSIGGLTITDSTGKRLQADANNVYTAQAGQKYTVELKVKVRRSRPKTISLVLMAALIPGLAHADTPTIPALTKSAVFTIGSQTVVVDGTPYQMDVVPYIDTANRTQVPVRFLGDVLGMTATWNSKAQQVTLSENTYNAMETLTIGNTKLGWVNESQDGVTTMDTTPVIVPPGRTMLPARWVAQAMGYNVSWNPTNQTVTVTPPGQPTSTGNAGAGTGPGNDGGVGTGTGITPPDTNNSVVPGGSSGHAN